MTVLSRQPDKYGRRDDSAIEKCFWYKNKMTLGDDEASRDSNIAVEFEDGR
jgi:hypothetical protein